MQITLNLPDSLTPEQHQKLKSVTIRRETASDVTGNTSECADY